MKRYIIFCMIAFFAPFSAYADPNSDLLEAASSGNLEEVKKALSSGARINARNRLGNTPLINACGGAQISEVDGSVVYYKTGSPHYDIAKYLIARKAAVNAKNRPGETPLMYACRNCNLELVKLLVKHRANIHARNSSGGNALIFALNHDRIWLHPWGKKGEADKPERNESECVKVAKFLIGRGINVNTTLGRGRNTILKVAASNGLEDLVDYLLKKGANVNQKDSADITALMFASNEKIMSLLIQKGARLDAQDNIWGWTALHRAARDGKKEKAAILIKAGANVNIRDTYSNRTPLEIAHWKGYTEIVEMLEKAGAKNPYKEQ